jgi:hypothetical protein
MGISTPSATRVGSETRAGMRAEANVAIASTGLHPGLTRLVIRRRRWQSDYDS